MRDLETVPAPTRGTGTRALLPVAVVSAILLAGCNLGPNRIGPAALTEEQVVCRVSSAFVTADGRRVELRVEGGQRPRPRPGAVVDLVGFESPRLVVLHERLRYPSATLVGLGVSSGRHGLTASLLRVVTRSEVDGDEAIRYYALDEENALLRVRSEGDPAAPDGLGSSGRGTAELVAALETEQATLRLLAALEELARRPDAPVLLLLDDPPLGEQLARLAGSEGVHPWVREAARQLRDRVGELEDWELVVTVDERDEISKTHVESLFERAGIPWLPSHSFGSLSWSVPPPLADRARAVIRRHRGPRWRFVRLPEERLDLPIEEWPDWEAIRLDVPLGEASGDPRVAERRLLRKALDGTRASGRAARLGDFVGQVRVIERRFLADVGREAPGIEFEVWLTDDPSGALGDAEVISGQAFGDSVRLDD